MTSEQFIPPSVNVLTRQLPDSSQSLHKSPLINRILTTRGLTKPSELELGLGELPRPDSLPDIDLAVSRLIRARNEKERVLIVGDYDCDGATSTAVALLGLQQLGFAQLEYLIPNRFEHGYGLSPTIVDIAAAQHQPDLIVTVDNGVASIEGIEHAKSYGIDVVVTDHHLPAEILPDAIAVVNPNLRGSQFPAVNLAGVGVMFYTLIALRAELSRLDDPMSKASLADLLDLVAIGTVADVVPLDATNRALVEQGLRRIRSGRTRPGVIALLDAAGRKPESMSTQDIGFGIGPRLNAAGRLDDMRQGVDCLLSDNAKEAKARALKLSGLNEQRRSIEQSMRADATEQLASLELDQLDQSDQFTVCLHRDDWHQGVIGILAGRIKESVHRPVVVFTADDDRSIKGSARSIPGVHIRDVLHTVNTQHDGLIEKFGGHAMAAGLTIKREQLPVFAEAFENAVREASDHTLRIREFLTDGSLAVSDRTMENASLLANLMPWGQGFEAPVFADYFAVISHKVVGNGHLKLSLRSWSEPTSQRVDAIAFNCAVEPLPHEPVFAVYSLEVNAWRDRRSLQLRVHYLEQSALR